MYEKRLIATAVSIFAVGVAVGIGVNNCNAFAVCAVFAIFAVVSAILLVCFSKIKGNIVAKRITAAAFAVAALSLGGLHVSLYDMLNSDLKAYDKCEDIASVKVDEVNNKYLDVTILHSDCGVPKYTKVRLYTTYYNGGLTNGDILKCELKYSYKPSDQLKSDGIKLTSSVSVINIEKGNGFIYSIRENINRNNEQLFGRFDYASEISKGVTIGDRSDMSSYVFALYRNSGISHLLAISGLHVSIIVLSVYNLLVSLCVNRKITNIVAILISLLFAAITGFSVGASRSAIMIIIVMGLGLFLRKSDSITSLFLALSLFLLINPYAICSLGLQLSFLCSLGILFISPLLESINFKLSIKLVKSKPIKRLMYKLMLVILIPLITSSVASVFSFPVSFFNFNTTSSLSPFINIIIIPVFSFAVKLAILAYLFAPVSVGLATLFSYPAGFLFNITTEFSKLIFDSNFGVVSSRTPIMIIPLICAVVGIVMIVVINRNRNLVAILSLALFGTSIFLCGILNRNYLNDVSVVECGSDKGEYVFCAVENRNIYVDMGGYMVHPEVIFETGSVYLENYVISEYNHLTYEHVEFMTTEIKVRNILLPYPQSESDVIYLDKIKLLANERECDIIYYENDCVTELSNDFKAEIVRGSGDAGEIETIYIRLGDVSIQILGDDFSKKVVCDYAIVLDKCKTDVKDIIAKTIFIQNGFPRIDQHNNYNISQFDKTVKFEVNVKESDLHIYES